MKLNGETTGRWEWKCALILRYASKHCPAATKLRLRRLPKWLGADKS